MKLRQFLPFLIIPIEAVHVKPGEIFKWHNQEVQFFDYQLTPYSYEQVKAFLNEGDISNVCKTLSIATVKRVLEDIPILDFAKIWQSITRGNEHFIDPECQENFCNFFPYLMNHGTLEKFLQKNDEATQILKKLNELNLLEDLNSLERLRQLGPLKKYVEKIQWNKLDPNLLEEISLEADTRLRPIKLNINSDLLFKQWKFLDNYLEGNIHPSLSQLFRLLWSDSWRFESDNPDANMMILLLRSELFLLKIAKMKFDNEPNNIWNTTLFEIMINAKNGLPDNSRVKMLMDSFSDVFVNKLSDLSNLEHFHWLVIKNGTDLSPRSVTLKDIDDLDCEWPSCSKASLRRNFIILNPGDIIKFNDCEAFVMFSAEVATKSESNELLFEWKETFLSDHQSFLSLLRVCPLIEGSSNIFQNIFTRIIQKYPHSHGHVLQVLSSEIDLLKSILTLVFIIEQPSWMSMTNSVKFLSQAVYIGLLPESLLLKMLGILFSKVATIKDKGKDYYSWLISTSYPFWTSAVKEVYGDGDFSFDSECHLVLGNITKENPIINLDLIDLDVEFKFDLDPSFRRFNADLDITKFYQVISTWIDDIPFLLMNWKYFLGDFIPSEFELRKLIIDQPIIISDKTLRSLCYALSIRFPSLISLDNLAKFNGLKPNMEGIPLQLNVDGGKANELDTLSLIQGERIKSFANLLTPPDLSKTNRLSQRLRAHWRASLLIPSGSSLSEMSMLKSIAQLNKLLNEGVELERICHSLCGHEIQQRLSLRIGDQLISFDDSEYSKYLKYTFDHPLFIFSSLANPSGPFEEEKMIKNYLPLFKYFGSGRWDDASVTSMVEDLLQRYPIEYPEHLSRILKLLIKYRIFKAKDLTLGIINNFFKMKVEFSLLRSILIDIIESSMGSDRCKNVIEVIKIVEELFQGFNTVYGIDPEEHMRFLEDLESQII